MNSEVSAETLERVSVNSASLSIKAPFGLNVIGNISSNSGLAVAARNVVQVLLDRGIPVATFDVRSGGGMEKDKHDIRFEQYSVKSLEELPHGVNVVLVSMHTLPHFLLHAPGALFDQSRLNVAWIFWELTVLPELWLQALRLFDVLIAPSAFIRGVLEANVSDVVTISGTHPLYPPAGVRPDRDRFGLPHDKVLFVTSFDPFGDPQRKNPFAVIAAFQRAFQGHDDVGLVIKINSAKTNRSFQAIGLARELDNCCRSDARILVLYESMDYADVLSLYASCDVFVSLHRAEGLGLGPMEAMSLGKPVIATGWSGNMTYMDHTNSCPVGYRLVPVKPSVWVYSKKFLRKKAVWAEPDVNHAAAWMKRLAEDADLRDAIGLKAAVDIAAHQRQAELGHFIDELKAIWEARSFLPARAKDPAEELELLRKLDAGTYVERLTRKLERLYDRHIGWRFQREQGI